MASKNEYREYRKGDSIIVAPAQGIYEQSSTQMAPLGTRIAFADGRVFRYARAGGTALSPGKFVKPTELTSANWVNKAASAAVAAGLYSVTLATTTAITTAAEGWLQINDADGEGIQYKIKKTAANGTTSTSTDVTLYDPIATALTTSSEGTIILNPYYYTVVCSAVTDVILGVPPIAVTAEYYYWLQTWGMACVWSEGVPAAGYPVQVAVQATGSIAGVTNKAADTTAQVGIMQYVGVDEEYKPVYLTIAP